ncbi:LysR family transcriptional regulator [Pseudoduganella albidiflava]|uniref:LysR family transcriptional regulator n=1 Tax=Pseudoduganella albidiflava TaxID=321983 RepID=A0A411X3J8_9BURK|nr:LysR family transcriptional regulator [Pseudoduganella albidiflava]QBI03579.1 LysR family transcriptional regulator [Pseudoduganella albidiflava]GGY51146.1 LysR family transcriptional regulator [Pseudoduganella albidiflava]
MDTIRSLQFFVRAVELGSLSAVAREEGTTQPTVSKVIAALEREVGARLLERSTTSLAPTAEGRRFHERARGLLAEFDAAVTEARGGGAALRGLLRVSAPVALGQFRLNALVLEFLALHPAIELELILNDRMVDLVEEGVDVAVRLGGDLPGDMVARKVAVSARLLVAAPAYLARHAPPRTPDQLAQHEQVRFAWLPAGDVVTLHDGSRSVAVTVKSRYRVNHALAIRDSLAQGAGIGLCPAWLVGDLLDAGTLQPVLPGWHGTPQEVHLLAGRHRSARARALIDFLGARLPALPGFDGVA